MTPRPLRWAAIGLLAVSAVIHLWMFPEHAGLVAGAHAHPKKERAAPPTTLDEPTATTGWRQRPEPPMAAAAVAAELDRLDPAQRYVGWLFLVGAAGLLIAARRVRRDQPVGWHLGAAICAAMNVGLLAAVTVGLPGGYTTTWEPQALVCLTAQVGFLGLWVRREHLTHNPGRPATAVA
jgi:hypothetical protein